MRKDKINIVYEDTHIIVVNKPAGLLTIATENEKEKTLFHKVISFMKTKNCKAFIVHRLDRDTSGLIIFAKSEHVKRILQDNWDTLVISRNYVAVVEGIVPDTSGTIKNWLKETPAFYTFSSTKPNDGKLAITKYKKIASTKDYTLLNISLLTGRKNQIRVHMKDINHPIIGDKKYGAKTNYLKRLGLHANILELHHPITHQLMHFEIPIPKEMLAMFPQNNVKDH